MRRLTHPQRAPLAGLCAALTVLTLAAMTAPAGASPVSNLGAAPIVRVQDGAVRGAAGSGADEFLGLPYAAPPTGNLRWRPPQPPGAWAGVRDASQFAPSCPQQSSPFAPPGPFSEDCLYLNVYTSTLLRNADRPVVVWIRFAPLGPSSARLTSLPT